MHQGSAPGPPGLRRSLRLISAVRFLVPRPARQRWLREWQAELWHAQHTDRWLLLASLNSIPHALCLRRQGWSFDMLTQDLRYAFRQLISNPGFTLVAVLTLALGIGANTLIYSVIDSTLIHPLPFRDADRIVFLWRSRADLGLVTTPTQQQLHQWREQVDGLEQIEPLDGQGITLTGEDEPLQLHAVRVSSHFFSFLGVEPALGRGFTAQEAATGGDQVVVLADELWRSQFAADPAVLEREIRLDGAPYVVVGVMPAGFRLQWPFSRIRLWLPFVEDLEQAGGVAAIARLEPGVSIEVVNEQLAAAATGPAADDLTQQWKGVAMRPGAPGRGRFATALWTFQGAVGLVLLIAAANVANLLLARGNSRWRELAIRAAIGAGRGRLVRQLLSENLLLAAGGGLMGLLLARGGLELIVRLRPQELNALDTLRMDPRLLLVTAAITLMTGLLFGLAPAFRSAGSGLLRALNEGSRAGGTGGRQRLRKTLVVAEIALSTVLLIGAGLLVNSFLRTQRIDAGFDTHNLLAVELNLPESRYGQQLEQQQFWERLAERLAASRPPTVESFAFAGSMPPKADIAFGAIVIEGQPSDPDPESINNVAALVHATPEYFRVLRIPLVAGRYFTTEDSDSPDRPVIVNQLLADTYWPGRSPIGDRMRVGTDEERFTVVGVVGDIQMLGLTTQIGERQLYVPSTGGRGGWIAVRGTDDLQVAADWVRSAIWSVDPEVPLTEVTTARALLGDSIARPRFNASMMAMFAAVAVLLALIGVYGVLSYSVAQRTHEIGVRMALGAQPAGVLRSVVGSGMGLIATGLVIGVGAAIALGRVIASLLYELEPTDPTTYAFVVLVLLATGIVACAVPAARASRVDPMIALRSGE